MFTEPLPENATIGDLYSPAMKITSKKEAEEYLEKLIERNIKITSNSREKATSIEKANIGYFAGYYGTKTAQRVYKLFMTSHPIFGTSQPTPKEAFEKGRERGRQSKKGK